MNLTDEEIELIRAYRKGKSIIYRCRFGLGVVVHEDDSGRVVIEVGRNPIGAGYDGFALREEMHAVIADWSRQLSGIHEMQSTVQ